MLGIKVSNKFPLPGPAQQKARESRFHIVGVDLKEVVKSFSNSFCKSFGNLSFARVKGKYSLPSINAARVAQDLKSHLENTVSAAGLWEYFTKSAKIVTSAMIQRSLETMDKAFSLLNHIVGTATPTPS